MHPLIGFALPGLDHGVGHPLLLLCNAKAPNYRKNNPLNGLGRYYEWPKVADAVIKAHPREGKLLWFSSLF